MRAGRVLIFMLAALLCAATPGNAAARRAPQNFYGVSWDASLNSRPWPDQRHQWDLMASSGVETTRVVFSWAGAQPTFRGPFSFIPTDKLVALAATHGIQLLPTVIDAPRWARLDEGKRNSPPRYASDYGAYLKGLVSRYGPHGSFWAEHPEIPRRPIREWQIWNEPDLSFYWDVPSDWSAAWPGGYVRLLKAAKKAVKSHDRKGKVVLAGLSSAPATQMRRLYRRGARRYFDVAAVHPYTAGPKDALSVIRGVRAVMRRNHDRRKPIWVTELGWPAARGKLSLDAGLRRLVTSAHGMASRIGPVYDSLLRTRRNKRYGVQRLYWYTWASSYVPTGEAGIWNFSGLVAALPLTVEPKPALAAYRSAARRGEGCAKSTRGGCR